MVLPEAALAPEPVVEPSTVALPEVEEDDPETILRAMAGEETIVEEIIEEDGVEEDPDPFGAAGAAVVEAAVAQTSQNLMPVAEAEAKLGAEVLDVLDRRFKGRVSQVRRVDERDLIFSRLSLTARSCLGFFPASVFLRAVL